MRNAAASRWFASVSTLASATSPPRAFDRGLEHRRELPARPAPRGPEVDDDRQLLGALDDVLLERGLGGVEDHASRLPSVTEFTVERAGVTLSGEEAGEGVPVVLLHGLTATRRYVVMGSRALERSGHRVVAYDARGHGRSSPAPDPADYGYEALAADLLAVLDERGIERAVLAGASMGAHTIVRLALDHGDRVAGLVLITPALHARGRAQRPRALGRAVGRAAQRRASRASSPRTATRTCRRRGARPW